MESTPQELDPKEINYDKPLDLFRMYSEPIPLMNRCSVLWCDIISIEEYPNYYNETNNWGEYKDTPKCYVVLSSIGTCIVASSYDFLLKYWSYYRQHIYMDNTQVPHGLRKDKMK